MSNDEANISRRDFLKNLAIGGGSAIVLGGLGFMIHEKTELGTIKAIVVDFNKCTGCRTCETICSAHNNTVIVNGEKLNGLGNPNLSNIQVHHYNPDVDIPMICYLCKDNPCINACVVPPDIFTGRKALYRDHDTLTIKNDLKRCLGCGECAKACKEERAGIIVPNPKTGKPERMCNLCDGDPQCVKHCPYDALSYVEIDNNREYAGYSPNQIAEKLFQRFYPSVTS